MREELDEHGFAVVEGFITGDALATLSRAVDAFLSNHQSSNLRNLCERIPQVAQFAKSPQLLKIAAEALDSLPVLVRSILFTKTADANWQILWHQDLAIAVRERHEVDGFSGWSVKEGVSHVQPPARILENMVAIRLHLDETDERNGALLVSPGTHNSGRIPADQAPGIARSRGIEVCNAHAGDLLLMRPLLLHASKKGVNPNPRRVIHLEFAAGTLPAPLEWAEALG